MLCSGEYLRTGSEEPETLSGFGAHAQVLLEIRAEERFAERVSESGGSRRLTPDPLLELNERCVRLLEPGLVAVERLPD